MYLYHEELALTILVNHNLLKNLAYHLELTGFMTAERWNLFDGFLLELFIVYKEVYEDWVQHGFYHLED